MDLGVGTRQFVILGRGPQQMAPIGTRQEVRQRLSRLNTQPDDDGPDVLWGPGVRIELPPGDPVTQMLLTVNEEEIAWQVIGRVLNGLDCKLLDPATGRELNG